MNVVDAIGLVLVLFYAAILAGGKHAFSISDADPAWVNALWHARYGMFVIGRALVLAAAGVYFFTFAIHGGLKECARTLTGK